MTNLITIEEIEDENFINNEIIQLKEKDININPNPDVEIIKKSDNKRIITSKENIKYFDGDYKNILINYKKRVNISIKNSNFIKAQIRDLNGTITTINFKENSIISTIIITKKNKIKKKYIMIDDIAIKIPVKKI